MTNRDPAPHSAASWVDEVLKPAPVQPVPEPTVPEATVLSGPQDLKLPGDVGSPPSDPNWPTENWSADDWVARVTGGTSPTLAAPAPLETRPAIPAPEASAPVWDDPAPTFTPLPLAEDVGQKKLTAGLLAIFLGGLGVHKFYLGLTTPGLVLLGVNVGVWLLAILLGLMMFVLGLALTLPVAAFVSSALSLVGLIEGIIYLTKSDAEFQREYLIQKKPWF